MALRSATESAGLFAIFRKLELADDVVLRAGRELLFRVVSMLTRMVNKLRAGESGTGTGTGRATGSGAEESEDAL